MTEVHLQTADLLLSTLVERDQYTHDHSGRVERLALELGRLSGLSDEALCYLRWGAVFHDLGKIGVPDRVLQKTTSLEHDEWEAMKAHSAIGERILMKWQLPRKELVAKAVRHHHEHFDGGGYPDGLKGDAIPLFARIISVVDNYDAQVIGRSYHDAFPHTQVIRTMRDEAGSKLDPHLVSLFADFIETSPLKALG